MDGVGLSVDDCPVCGQPLGLRESGMMAHLLRFHTGSTFTWHCAACAFADADFDALALHCLVSGHDASGMHQTRHLFRDQVLRDALTQVQNAFR